MARESAPLLLLQNHRRCFCPSTKSLETTGTSPFESRTKRWSCSLRLPTWANLLAATPLSFDSPSISQASVGIRRTVMFREASRQSRSLLDVYYLRNRNTRKNIADHSRPLQRVRSEMVASSLGHLGPRQTPRHRQVADAKIAPEGHAHEPYIFMTSLPLLSSYFHRVL